MNTPFGVLKKKKPKRKTPPSTGSEASQEKVRHSKKISKRDLGDIVKDLADSLEVEGEETETESDVSVESDGDHREEVEMATKPTMSAFDDRITEMFAQFRDELIQTVHFEIGKVNDRVDKLTERVEKCETDLENRESACKQEMNSMKIAMNKQAQYTRAYNIRIFGIPEAKPIDNEDMRGVMCEFFEEKLDVNVKKQEIAAAHRLPTRKEGKPRPIIVRFAWKETKYALLKVRKKLKGSGQSITEDVTSDNMRLMNRAEKSNKFSEVWFSNGRVHAIDKRTKNKKVLELFDTFG